MSLAKQLKIHFEMLKKWREAMDLVGPGDLFHHFEESKLR